MLPRSATTLSCASSLLDSTTYRIYHEVAFTLLDALKQLLDIAALGEDGSSGDSRIIKAFDRWIREIAPKVQMQETRLDSACNHLRSFRSLHMYIFGEREEASALAMTQRLFRHAYSLLTQAEQHADVWALCTHLLEQATTPEGFAILRRDVEEELEWAKPEGEPQRRSTSTPHLVAQATHLIGEDTAKQGKQSKGKNIDARMLKIAADNLNSYDWDSEHWAKVLECSSGTVRGTDTWKVRLPKLRALALLSRREVKKLANREGKHRV